MIATHAIPTKLLSHGFFGGHKIFLLKASRSKGFLAFGRLWVMAENFKDVSRYQWSGGAGKLI